MVWASQSCTVRPGLKKKSQMSQPYPEFSPQDPHVGKKELTPELSLTSDLHICPVAHKTPAAHASHTLNNNKIVLKSQTPGQPKGLAGQRLLCQPDNLSSVLEPHVVVGGENQLPGV